MPLNVSWLKLCLCCGKFWCDKGQKCGSPECECIQYLTKQEIRLDMLRTTTCGVCDMKIRNWLRLQEFCNTPRLLLVKGKKNE